MASIPSGHSKKNSGIMSDTDMKTAIKVLPESKMPLFYRHTRQSLSVTGYSTPISPPRRPRLLVGALSVMINYLIQEMKNKNKLILLEYNVFDYPTGEYESARPPGQTRP